MESAIRELLQQESFDAIVFSLVTFPAIARLPTPPLVADVCDAVGMHIRDRIAYAGWRGALLLRLALCNRQRLEQRVYARADHLLFATRRDLIAGAGAAADRASVVPNGVDTEFWKRGTNRLGHRTILFTGVMQYAPNTDAARLLAEQILPQVRREVPDAELLLVGRDPPPALRRTAERCGATVTGFVNDMRPYLERASLFAAPLRFGAGIQNKVLEAMSMELPVVTSGRVADGLRTQNGDAPPLQHFDEQNEFAKAVIGRLLASDRDLRPDAAGRSFVSAHFNWKGCGRRLEEAIENAVSVTRQMKPGSVCQSV
jgi:glycosyltransferase involved in cell wall biosynthesis